LPPLLILSIIYEIINANYIYSNDFNANKALNTKLILIFLKPCITH